MFKKPHYIAAGLMLLLALVLLNLPARATSRLKLAIGSIFLPLFGLAGGPNRPRRPPPMRSPRGTAPPERNPPARNQQLKILLLQAEENARADARLREQVGRLKPAPWRRKFAQVLSREPANWWRTITIDLGTRDGVRADLPVITAEGLIGKVSSVSFDRAQVILLGDPNCRVSALVENPARDQGIVGVAGGPFDGSLVQMEYLARSAANNIKPGQRVVSSGEGGVFPKGIPLGTIADTRPAETGMFLQAQVKLAANLSALEEVWVLFPRRSCRGFEGREGRGRR
jgi:rod shape-determining protein MreC